MKFIFTLIATIMFLSPLSLQSADPAAATSPASSPASATAKTNAALPPKIPLRDFFKNPVSRGYDLSPDGKMLSFLQPWESRMNIFVRPTAGGEAKRLTSEKDRDIRSYVWKGNGLVVYPMDDK
jgi:hypothetical protein